MVCQKYSRRTCDEDSVSQRHRNANESRLACRTTKDCITYDYILVRWSLDCSMKGVVPCLISLARGFGTSACTYVCMYVCMYIFSFICLDSGIYLTYSCECMYMCLCAYVHRCTCVHVYMYRCKGIYRYTYIYICSRVPATSPPPPAMVSPPPPGPRPPSPQAAPAPSGPAQLERTHANQREGGPWRMIPASASSQERENASEQGPFARRKSNIIACMATST